MAVQLRKVREQTLIITGASSGIGLATARLAGRRGARVVMVARGEDALRRAAVKVREDGGTAIIVPGDVARPEDMVRVADEARREFGGFDTWVNSAAVALYGRLDEIPLEDKRKLFDINFWGTVHGCRAALAELRRRGGTIINIGSMLSDLSIPLQGIYAASKHAIKAYTTALRMELEKEGAPVSVTLVKPGATDTPYYEHARNYMEHAPTPPPPVYAPEAVARAILACAEHPTREIVVGGAARALLAGAGLAPALSERIMERTLFDAQQSDRPARRYDDNLYEPADPTARERGRYPGPVLEHSLYTAAAIHPGRTALAAAGIGLAVAAGIRAIRSR
ncbi:MAG TPA: SDR family oxidoreductase [Gemmatimonadales bacterium]|nr:SDR family oxidoreductase [Gemmatimonadales bacterium]